jgi:peptide/nickel transport system substrate-binding protein/oligopeptide transport system substrate-binding protein
LRAATVEGLVGFDAQGRVVPAIAERWIVTDDGLSYIFRLRDGTWPDGTPIDAPSVAAALRRARAALAGTALGLDLAPIDEIRVMTDRVVEVDLSAPLPDLLTLLAQPEWACRAPAWGPARSACAAKGWWLRYPRSRPRSAACRHRTDLAQRAPVAWKWKAWRCQRFNDGLVDVALGGTIDRCRWPAHDALARERATRSGDGAVRLAGAARAGLLADPLRREALALAIDRDGLVGAFGIGGWSGTRLVSPEVPDDGSVGERWSDSTLDQRRARAPAGAGVDGGRGGRAPLARGCARWPGSRPALARIRADFASIGCRSSAWTKASRPTCAWLIPCALYARPGSSINWPAGKPRRMQPGRRCAGRAGTCRARSPGAHGAARPGRAHGHRRKRFIPIARPLRWSLVRSGVTGFSPNPWGWHPLPPLTVVPK